MLEIARERRVKPDVQGNCEYNISVLYVQKQSFLMQQVFVYSFLYKSKYITVNK